MKATRYYVVCLRANGGRLIADCFESAVAKAKSHPGSSVRPATKEDLALHAASVSSEAYLASNFMLDDMGYSLKETGYPVYFVIERDASGIFHPILWITDQDMFDTALYDAEHRAYDERRVVRATRRLAREFLA